MEKLLVRISKVLDNNILILFLYLSPFYCFSCTTTKGSTKTDILPALKDDVPINSSELRELRHIEKKEAGHGDLHFSGQLFTKSLVNGSPQIKPCSGCIIHLTSKLDTSLKINISTKQNGYFEFDGQKSSFILLVNTTGFNKVTIEPLDLVIGGTNRLVLINAAGNAIENFSVVRTNKEYTWRKLQ